MKLIFEKGSIGRRAVKLEADTADIPQHLKRNSPPVLPEVSELDLVRHYMQLSNNAVGVDNTFYPLGSCTMKYNPKINEKVASMEGFTNIHPLAPQNSTQGCLELMHNLQTMLCEITGFDSVSLNPAAGAHGEWTGLLLIKAYHEYKNDSNRVNVLIPDSAHGTNPASANMCGFNVISVPSDENGLIDISALEKLADENTAALMLTNPNTLGLFEKNITKIADIIHSAGGQLYYDGANLNAVMGITRPGDMGFDVMHINLHKTFATPHGGGGPGSGPVGCKEHLTKFLPVPIVCKEQDKYILNYDIPNSVGRVKSFYGNFLVCVKAYAYILSLGAHGLKEASQTAVLNANYMLRALEEFSDLKYSEPCMHEFVLSLEKIKKERGLSALDVAKALIDENIHPPTMYFPLIVHEALMFEPTETEGKETLDFAIESIGRILKLNAEEIKEKPTSKSIGRVDEVRAARNPVVKAEK